MKFGRHYRRLKLLYKCYKIQKTEVSHTDKTPVKPHLLRYIKIKLLGHGILPNRAPSKTKVNRLLNQDKVADHLKLRKKGRVLTHSVISGSKMSTKDGANMPDKNDDEKERHKKQSKDRNKKPGSSKSKKAKLSKLWEIDPEAFRHEVEMAYKSIKNRKGKRPLSQKEIRKHLDAISASMSELAALRGQKKKSLKSHPATEGTTNRGTNSATKPVNKRKRSDTKVKSEPDSDSSESQRMPNKRSSQQNRQSSNTESWKSKREKEAMRNASD